MAVQNSQTLGLCLGLIIFVFINLVQISINYAFSSVGDFSYGFPYPFYEYFEFIGRGRIWGLGVIVDLIAMLLFVFASGFVFPALFKRRNYSEISITETAQNQDQTIEGKL